MGTATPPRPAGSAPGWRKRFARTARFPTRGLLPVRLSLHEARRAGRTLTLAERRAVACQGLRTLGHEARDWGAPFEGRYEVEVLRRYLDLLAVAERRERARLNPGQGGRRGLYAAALGLAAPPR